MGWLYTHKPDGQKVVDFFRDRYGRDWWSTNVVTSTATREAAFLLVRQQMPDSTIYVPDPDGTVRWLLVLMIKVAPNAKDGCNFGWKDMAETAGPYGCEAPLSILKQASELQPMPADHDPESYSPLVSAHHYRERCRALARAKAAKRSMKPGTKVQLVEPLTFERAGDVQSFTATRYGRELLFSMPTGGLCRLSARNLMGATITLPTTLTRPAP